MRVAIDRNIKSINQKEKASKIVGAEFGFNVRFWPLGEILSNFCVWLRGCSGYREKHGCVR